MAPCWILGIVLGLFVLVITLISLSVASTTNRSYDQHSTTRCIASHIYDYKKITNETIHLVHNSDVWTENQIAVFEDILQNYNASTVHLVIVGCNKSSESYKGANPTIGKRATELEIMKREPRKRKRRRRSVDNSPYHRTLQEVLLAYPEIFLEKINYTEAFHNSPLYNTWQNLNEKTRLFALRTIYLWQYGGISFDLFEENYKNFSQYYNYKTTNSSEATLSKNVILGIKTSRNFSKSVVTIDDRGWHMASRTSCHAFFGDLLMNLKTAKSDATPEQIIKMTLKVFCKKGSIDSGYCKTVQ